MKEHWVRAYNETAIQYINEEHDGTTDGCEKCQVSILKSKNKYADCNRCPESVFDGERIYACLNRKFPLKAAASCDIGEVQKDMLFLYNIACAKEIGKMDKWNLRKAKSIVRKIHNKIVKEYEENRKNGTSS